MRSVLKIAALVMIAGMLPSWAAAQRPVNETRDADADARIAISNIAGSVILTGWDRNQVRITGTLDDDVDRLDILGDAGELRIEVVYEKHLRGIEGSDLEIQLPAGARVSVSTVSADLEASGLTQRLSAETVSGDVDIESKLTDLRIQTVSGEIMLRGGAGELRVQTVSGNVDLGEVDADEIAINTVSGDVELAADKLERLEVNTVSGDLDFAGRITRSGSFNSQSGDITLVFAGEPDAEFSVSTFSGDIDNAFGPSPEKKSKWTPGLSLEFTSGAGAANIDIESFSGDVSLERR